MASDLKIRNVEIFLSFFTCNLLFPSILTLGLSQNFYSSLSNPVLFMVHLRGLDLSEYGWWTRFFSMFHFYTPWKHQCVWGGGWYAAVTLKKWVKMPELKKTLTTLTRYFPEMNLKLTLIYENYQWTSLFLRKVQYLPKLSQQGDILLCHHDNSNKPLQKFFCNF